MNHWTLRHAFNHNLWDAVQLRIGRAIHTEVQNSTLKATIDLFLMEPFELGNGTFTMTSLLAREIGR